MSRVDLHLHSNASDGRLKPEALVARAAELGMEFISLTDHDTVDGIIPALKAARKFPGLKFIPGVEISTDITDGEAHILGYFIDYKSQELAKELARFRGSRETRAQRMVEKLRVMGMAIEWARVQEIAGEGSIGRPHIAEALMEKGYISKFEEAFDKYIGHGKPAYVERDKMTPEEAVALVLRSGGIPVLAHPFTVKDPEALIKTLKAAGLAGMEVYYKDNTPEQSAAMLKLTSKYGLIATGGTDYHAIGDSAEVMIGGADVPVSAAEKLIGLAGKQALKRAVL